MNFGQFMKSQDPSVKIPLVVIKKGDGKILTEAIQNGSEVGMALSFELVFF